MRARRSTTDLPALLHVLDLEETEWWARGASIPGPHGYQPCALTKLSYGPVSTNIGVLPLQIYNAFECFTKSRVNSMAYPLKKHWYR